MPQKFHVVCPYCSTTNRLPEAKPANTAKCGKCGRKVFDGQPLNLTTQTFQRHITSNDIPVVVDFWAEWCGPCKMMAPEFTKAAADLEPIARFAKLNTETEQAIAAQFGIRSIPTLMVFKDGKEIARQAGAMSSEQLKTWVKQFI